MKHKKAIKITAISTSVLLFVFLLPSFILSIASTNWGKEKVLDIANSFIEAELTVDTLKGTYLSSFPYISLTIENSALKSKAVDSLGYAEGAEELVSLKKLSVSINVLKLLKGEIYLKDGIIETPTIFGYVAENGKANWEIVESDTIASEGESSIPYIYLESFKLTNGSIKYLSKTDSMNICLSEIGINAEGKYAGELFSTNGIVGINKIEYQQLNHPIKASIDSLQININAALDGDRINLTSGIESSRILYSDSLLNTKEIPLTVNLIAGGELSKNSFRIEKFEIESNTLSSSLIGDIAKVTKGWQNKLAFKLTIDDAQDLIDLVPYPFAKSLNGLKSSGRVDINIKTDGIFGDSIMPNVQGNFDLEMIELRYISQPYGIDRLDLEASASYNNDTIEKSVLDISKVYFRSNKSEFTTSVKTENILKDPKISAKVKAFLNLDHLSNIFPPEISKYFTIKGKLNSDIVANFKLNDLLAKKLKLVYINGKLDADNLIVTLPEQKFSLNTEDLIIELGLNSIKSRRYDRNMLFSGRFDFKKFKLDYDNTIKFDASQFKFSGYADNLAKGVPLMRASLSMNSIHASYQDTLLLSGRRIRFSNSVAPDTLDPLIPLLTSRITLDSISYVSPVMGVLIDSTTFSVGIKPKIRIPRRTTNADGTPRVFAKRTEIKLDSIVKIFNASMAAEDFTGELLKRFTMKGFAKSKSIKHSSPYLPINMELSKVDATFSEDTLLINNILCNVGSSDFIASGHLFNMRRYFYRNSTLDATLDIKSTLFDANEILRALYEGDIAKQEADKERKRLARERRRQKITGELAALDSVARQEKIEQMKAMYQRMKEEREAKALEPKVQDSIQLEETPVIFPISKKINARLTTSIDSIKYSNLTMNSFTGNIRIKEGVLQIRNLATTTDIGKVDCDLIYKCDSIDKADIGFDLSTNKIDVGKLVDKLPFLDSIMPMLRSFKGKVDAEISGMASVDSFANIDLPSVNAAASLQGTDLVLLDGETFSEVAKMLMFSKKTENEIQAISIELMVEENKLNILPFMLEMDKYRVAIGGQHSFDNDINYHISVLKSPLPFKLGVDVYGNMDKFKYKLVSPKYKDEKSVTRSGQFIDGPVNIRAKMQQELKEAIENAIKD